MFTCEVGARGLVTQEVVDQLEKCAKLLMGERGKKGAARKEARSLAGEMAREAVLRSYAVWVRRNTEWCDFDEVRDRRVDVEKGLHELDAGRQKKEKEEKEARGCVKEEWLAKMKEEDDAEAVEKDANQLWKIGLREARVAAEASVGVVRAYPDGSETEGRAGWGFVAVLRRMAGGREEVVREECGPVVTSHQSEGWSGCQFHSNNAGELSAICKILEWWQKSELRRAFKLIIVPDSLWAVGVAIGGRARYHRIAAWAAQEAAKSAEAQFGWVKGHSEHKWNDRADELANRGRAMGTRESGGRSAGRSAPTKARGKGKSGVVESASYEWVVEEERLSSVGLATAGKIKKGTVGRDANGRRRVETLYVRRSRFGRRNATGASLQFMSKVERAALVGQSYAELDMKSAHPTVLWWAARKYGGEGMGLKRLGQLARCSEGLVAEVRKEFAGRTKLSTVEDTAIKRILLAAINGAGVERMARDKLGGWVVNGALDQFRREVAKVRAQVMTWRPDIAEEVRRRNPEEPEWKLRVKTAYFLMTEGEDAVLRVMEEVAKDCGLQGDAPTGDGVLVREGAEGGTRSVAEVISRVQEQVERRTGIPMRIGVKNVSGDRVSSWPWQKGHG